LDSVADLLELHIITTGMQVLLGFIGLLTLALAALV